MTNTQTDELSIAIGKIEDTLQDIQSAKRQVDDVLGANTALSHSLESLITQTNQVIAATKSQAEDLSGQIEEKLAQLSGYSSKLEELAKQGVASIKGQAEEASTQLSSEAAALNNKSIKSFNKSAEEALSKMEEPLKCAQASLIESTERFETASAGFRDQLAGQVEEIEHLLTTTKEQLEEAKKAIGEIADIDLEPTNKRIDDLREMVSARADEAKRQSTTITSLLIGCLIVGVIVLVKLFVM
jgi:chromosome segregation ATPase